jgi:acyl-coenzyme A synthetase/AMP-(fatty) acid ligase
MTVLYERLATSLDQNPESVVGNLSSQLTFKELHDLAIQKGRALREVLGHGGPDRPRVAIIRKNSPDYVSDFLAVLHADGVPFLMDPALAAHEVDVLHRQCGLDAILHDDSAQLPVVGHPVECDHFKLRPLPETPRPQLHSSTEVCRLSSGSTRSPACIEFSGGAVLAAADAWRSASGLRAMDRVLCFAGLYNGLAFNTSFIPGLLSGANLFFPSGLPSAGNLERHFQALRPTVLVAFPVAYDLLARSEFGNRDRACLRLALSSAAKLNEETSAILSGRGIRIADYYGIAETGPLTFNTNPMPGGGQGYPLPGVSLRTDGVEGEIGILLAKSRSMGTRYLNYPGELESRITEDGYLRTTDRGSLSTNGELRLAERVGRSLALGGRKFSSDEVEAILKSHPGVAMASVAVVTPPGGREVLGAVVVRAASVDAVELRRHCLSKVAAFKVPERIIFVETLPASGSGKIQAAAVEQILLAEHAVQSSWRKER